MRIRLSQPFEKFMNRHYRLVLATMILAIAVLVVKALIVFGSVKPKIISPNQGWNLLGYNSATSLSVTKALESIWGFKAGAWKFYYPAFLEYSNLETVEPNNGYRIKTTKARDWIPTQRFSSCSDYIPCWGEVKKEPFNIYPSINVKNPVLTAKDVKDVEAKFVADPFLFHENGLWYMFFEVLNKEKNHGEIGLATSSDGLDWNYEKIVLTENVHLSFPYVFKYKGTCYMIPETSLKKEIRLYKSYDFPYVWKYEKTLISGKYFLDTSVFFYNGSWWMFTCESDQDTHLYYSDTLLSSNWTEHPQSPIVTGDKSKARGAGRTLVFGNNRIIRLAQKDDMIYGEEVRAFEVDKLTITEYFEHEIDESPILEADSGWNEYAAHHVDPWWDGREWLCAVDGQTSTGIWSIGIYNTPTSQTKWRLVVEKVVNDLKKLSSRLTWVLITIAILQVIIIIIYFAKYNY